MVLELGQDNRLLFLILNQKLLLEKFKNNIFLIPLKILK